MRNNNWNSTGKSTFMLTRKRIYIQAIYCILMLVLFGSQIHDVKLITICALSFAGILGIGCLLALTKQMWSKWFLLIGSAGFLCIGLYFNLLRFQFILINRGMDSATAPGSPVAFLMGWIFTTSIFLIPGAIFSYWNARYGSVLDLKNPNCTNLLYNNKSTF